MNCLTLSVGLGWMLAVICGSTDALASPRAVTLGPVQAAPMVRTSVHSEAQTQVEKARVKLDRAMQLAIFVERRPDTAGVKYEARVVITDTHKRLRHAVRAVARVSADTAGKRLHNKLARTATAHAVKDALNLLTGPPRSGS